ncbi:MAG: exodeoxyribonuclease VII large subunit, partial [Gemmatimonadaceae bacterium]
LSPLATLGRGYAAVFDASGVAITEIGGVQQGDAVRVRLRDGAFGARVESTTQGEAAEGEGGSAP